MLELIPSKGLDSIDKLIDMCSYDKVVKKAEKKIKETYIN